MELTLSWNFVEEKASNNAQLGSGCLSNRRTAEKLEVELTLSLNFVIGFNLEWRVRSSANTRFYLRVRGVIASYGEHCSQLLQSNYRYHEVMGYTGFINLIG